MDYSTSDKHQFALYYSNLATILSHDHVVITDIDMIHRMTRVLRLSVQDTCQVFDGYRVAHIRITKIDKKEVSGTILSLEKTTPLKPHITMLLPVLKRDDLEYAIYGLAELGINTIQLVTTEKTVRTWGGDKEMDRLHRIIIAACEQAKQYVVPILQKPIALSAVVSSTEKIIFADPQGDQINAVIDAYCVAPSQTYQLLVGPEGDLTSAEKKMLLQSGAQFCRLTPTVLRACQATVVLAGIFRSFFR